MIMDANVITGEIFIAFEKVIRFIRILTDIEKQRITEFRVPDHFPVARPDGSRGTALPE